MDKLRFPLSTFPERGLSIDQTVTEDEIRPPDAKGVSVGPVHVAGHLSKADDDYMFKGVLNGSYQHTCDRCLDEATVPFDVDAVWVFSENGGLTTLSESGELSDDDEDRDEAEDSAFPVAIENDQIDLRPLVWEEVVLNAPSKYLCKEDCAGLCPRCGANLNREVCECRPEAEERLPHGGLARLGELFPDLKQKSEE